jgi:hypothetical protein
LAYAVDSTGAAISAIENIASANNLIEYLMHFSRLRVRPSATSAGSADADGTPDPGD